MTILALSSLDEKRDVATGNHLHQTQNYLCALIIAVPGLSYVCVVSPTKSVEILYKWPSLHYNCKVGIPSRILLKS